MAGQLWRHGDVLIQAVDALPDGGTRENQPVLAYGEVTGHSHRIETPDAAEVWHVGNDLYMKVLAPTRIVHEEHQPIALDPGVYRVWQQREYVPESQRRMNGIVDFLDFRSIRD